MNPPPKFPMPERHDGKPWDIRDGMAIAEAAHAYAAAYREADREAMRMALEQLQEIDRVFPHRDTRTTAITALTERLND
jgi:hypothetical protein